MYKIRILKSISASPVSSIYISFLVTGALPGNTQNRKIAPSAREAENLREMRARITKCLGCDGFGRMPNGYHECRKKVMETMQIGDTPLMPDDYDKIYRLADGFGVTPDGRPFLPDEFDFSAIRDASVYSVLEMAAAITYMEKVVEM